MRKGEELKAPRYASAATRDYITTRDIIPNNFQAQTLREIHENYIF